MTVLAHWCNKESAVERTMVLARLCDNSVDSRANNGALALLAIPCSLVRGQVGDGANGVACSLACRRVSGRA
jgi:hypothetical protein